MTDWQIDDVVVAEFDRFVGTYFEVYAPDGTLRGTITPSVTPGADTLLYKIAFPPLGARLYFNYVVGGGGGEIHLASMLADGTAADFFVDSANLVQHGIAFDGAGMLYHFAGFTDDFSLLRIQKRDPSDLATVLAEYTYAYDDSDPNLIAPSSGTLIGSYDAATLAVSPDGATLYFSSTESLSGTFPPNFYAVNRIDTATNTTLPALDLSGALASPVSTDRQLPFVCGNDGNLRVMYQRGSGPYSFELLTVDSAGALVTSIALTPQDPNDVGNDAEIDDLALSANETLVWTMENGGPMTAYDGAGSIVYRFHIGTSIIGDDVHIPTALAVVPQVPGNPPCQAVDFTGHCGDVLTGFTQLSCVAIEGWRNGLRIGRIALAGAPTDQMNTLALDRDSYLYVPFYLGTYAPNVLRFGDGAKHYTSTATTWFTPPTADEFPVSVSVDRRNNLYVLVCGGDPLFHSTTYLRLYKLNAAGTILATFDLDLPAGHTTDGVVGGAAVAPDGSRYLYQFQDDTTGVIAAWDLTNDVALADFYLDATGSDFFPAGGLRFHPDGRVLATNFATSTSLLSIFPAIGATRTDQDGGFSYNGGDLALERVTDPTTQTVLIADFFGSYDGEPAVLRMVLATGALSLAFHIGETLATNNMLLAVLCGGRVYPGLARLNVAGTEIWNRPADRGETF
jgi:hypothetical protein